MHRFRILAICIAVLALVVGVLVFPRPSASKVSPLSISFVGYTNLTPALQRTVIGDTNNTPGIRYGVFRISNRSSSRVIRHGPFYPETASGEYGLSDFPNVTLAGGFSEVVFVLAPPTAERWRMKALHIGATTDWWRSLLEKTPLVPSRLRQRMQPRLQWATSDWIEQ